MGDLLSGNKNASDRANCNGEYVSVPHFHFSELRLSLRAHPHGLFDGYRRRIGLPTCFHMANSIILIGFPSRETF